jgi:hypothetical protein
VQNEDVFKVELDWMSFKVDLDWMFFFVLKNGHTQCPPSHTLQEQGCKHWLIQAQRERWHELYSEPRRNFFTSEVPLVLKYLNNTEWVAHRTEDVVRAYSREVPFMLTLAWAQYLYTNSIQFWLLTTGRPTCTHLKNANMLCFKIFCPLSVLVAYQLLHVCIP